MIHTLKPFPWLRAFTAIAWGGNAKLGGSEEPPAPTRTHTPLCSNPPSGLSGKTSHLITLLPPSVHSLPIFSSPVHPLSPPSLWPSLRLSPSPVSAKFIEVDNRGKCSLLFSARLWLVALMWSKFQSVCAFPHYTKARFTITAFRSCWCKSSCVFVLMCSTVQWNHFLQCVCVCVYVLCE